MRAVFLPYTNPFILRASCSCFSVLSACVFYFCICTCSAQLSMFHMEKRSRNTLIIILLLLTSDKQDGPKGEVHKNIVKKSGQAQLTFSV